MASLSRPTGTSHRPTRQRAAIPALVAAALLLTGAPAAGADRRTLELISDGPFDSPDVSQPAFLAAISQDAGRAFTDAREALAASDSDIAVDTYEPAAGRAFTHLTENPIAPDANVDGHAFASGDGTRTFIRSAEPLAASDTDQAVDIYERSATGTLAHLTDNPNVGDGNFSIGRAQASRDGRHLVFETQEPLAPTDTDHSLDVYEYGPDGLVVLSDDPSGLNDELDVRLEEISDDGRTVAFETTETLDPADTDSRRDVYVRTRTGGLTPVSDVAGPDLEIDMSFVNLSDDGTRVLFITQAQLLLADSDNADDLYQRTADGALSTISDGPSGLDADDAAQFAGASSDVERVLFQTVEPLLPTDTDSALDPFERRADGALVHLTATPGGPDANDPSYAQPSREGDRAFITTRDRLAPTDTDTAYDLYVRSPGRPFLHVSDDPTGPDDELDISFAGDASSDGTRVYFSTKEPLSATDTDTADDIYGHTAAGGLLHVSDGPSGWGRR